MLQVTSSAVDELKRVRSEADAALGSAVRIQLMQTPQGEQAIAFSFVGEAEAGDTAVVEDEELSVFVAPELNAPLENAVLDTSEQEGERGFVIHDRDGA